MAGGMCHDFNPTLGYGALLSINRSLADSEVRKVEVIMAAAAQARSMTPSGKDTVVAWALITDLETFLRAVCGSKMELMTDLRRAGTAGSYCLKALVDLATTVLGHRLTETRQQEQVLPELSRRGLERKSVIWLLKKT